MKKVIATLLLLVGLASFAQITNPPGYVAPVNGSLNSVVGPAGLITNSNLTITVSPGPIYCRGANETVHNTTFALTASTTYFVWFDCSLDQVVVGTTLAAGPQIVPLANIITNATTVATNTDLRGTANFPNVNDGYFFVPETACGGAVTGTAGAGNATDIVALSGGVRVFRLSNTNAGASTNTFTCVFQVPGRLTAGKGITINDITFLVSTQTTQPTSITLPTLKSITAPAAVDPETANSATFVTFGGTITTAPSSAQFAAYAAVSAGQFFSLKVILGTPAISNTDLQMFQLVIPFVQSAAAAGVQETPGFFVHYTYNM